MMKRYAMTWLLVVLAVTGNGASVSAGVATAEKDKPNVASDDGTVILDTKSVWRMYVTQRQPVVGSVEKAEPMAPDPKTGRQTITDLPPSDWTTRDFYDVGWLRRPGPFYGSPYGFGEPRSVALLCLRAGFMVPDPAKAPELKLQVSFRGGIRVYLNGNELVRKHLRDGEIGPETLAEDYPLEAYVTPEGGVIDGKSGPAAQKERCEKRIRRLEGFTIPAKHLVKGLNVVAIEAHRAAITPEGDKPGGDWSSLGVMQIRLAASGAGDVTPNLARPKGLQAWAANAFDIVRDVDFGDPCDTPKPVSLVGVRNGEFCGAVVVSSDTPIKGLKAEVGDLELAGGGGRIPSSAARIGYALLGSNVRDNYGFIKSPVRSYDSLMNTPPAEVAVAGKEVSGDTGAIKPVWGAVQPVWLTVKVPSDAKPGDYEGRVSIRTEGGGNAAVGIRLRVINWTLPDPINYRTFADFIESPESVALHYEVPLWSEKHFALLDKSLEQLGRIGTKTIYLNLIGKSNLGNAETIVRWIKKADGAGYDWDFAPMEKYLDLCEKRLGKPWVVCCFLWDAYLEGGWYEGKVPGVLVSSIDPQTGKVTELNLPKSTSAEGQPIWKAFGLELQARLKKRGLEKSMMLGTAMDSIPNNAFIDYWKTVLPDVPWVAQGHGIKLELNNVPVGYCSTVWNQMGVPDPAGPNRKETHGWQFPQYLLRIGRRSPPQRLVGANDRDFGYKPYESQVVDGRMKGEHNIHGQSGFGRMSADFWPCIKDAKGNMTRGIASRYPFSDWHQLNLTMIPFLAAGPDGALPTIRFEMIREGVQECEARIRIDETLIDKTKRAKIGEDPAQALQALLDVRTRAVLYDYQTGWQYRSETLYAAAAEVEKLLSMQDQLGEFKKMADAGKKDEAAGACRKFIRENEKYPSVQAAGLARLVEILGEGAFDDLAAALDKKNAGARAPLAKVAASLKGDGVSNKWLAALKKAGPPVRAGILETFVERADKAALPAARECLGDKDEAVRTAAAIALARLGGKDGIPELVNVLQAGAAGECDAVAAELVRMPGDEASAAIAEAIGRAKPAVKVALLGVLAKRNARAQVAEVLAAAADKEESVRVAALRALNALADEKTLPAVIGLLTKAGTDSERQLAEMAATSACERIKDAEKCFGPVNGALDGASVPVRCSLLRVLGHMAGPKALQVVQGALEDKNADIHDAAVPILCAWPTADAADGLLQIVRSDGKEPQKLAAHQGYARLVGLPSERPAEKTLAMIKAGLETALRPDEKKILLSGLGKLKLLDALKVAEAYFDDAAVQQEAGMAMVSVAEAVGGTSRGEATAVLKKVIAKVRDKKPAQAALARIEMYDDHITAWKAAGPYTQEGKKVEELFGAAFPPENPEAKDVEWKPVPAESEPAKAWQVDLAKVIGEKNRIAYLRTTVESPVQQEAQLEMGSSGGIKVWLNGTQIHAKSANRAIKAGEDRVKVSLKAGSNVLLIKAAPGNSGWAVCARFRKPDGSALDGLQIKAE